MTAVRCIGPEAAAIARRWIGTPYRHQASCEGVGADCLGLLRGIWRELYGDEPEAVPAYTADWAEASGEEQLLSAARRWLSEVPAEAAEPGDALLFRMRDRGPAKHVAILVRAPLGRGRIVHAYSGHAVCETGLAESWLRRLAGVFRLPSLGNEGSGTWQR